MKFISKEAIDVFAARVGAAFALLFFIVFLHAPRADAAFEQVSIFGEGGENQLASSTGLAVNVTGAGGVPPGSVYAAVARGPEAAVARYTAKGEFREGWTGNVENGFHTCGPDGEPSRPSCPVQFGQGGYGIAVSQVTGYVYVFVEEGPANTKGDAKSAFRHVLIFNADGSQLIDVFGERGLGDNTELGGIPGGETFEEGPENFHTMPGPSDIAVDNSGAVYIIDRDNHEGRVMSFKPQTPGDYEHYVYTGRANDIRLSNFFVQQIAVDDAGNLYGAVGEEIVELKPGDPELPSCRYEVADGGAYGLTVNPTNGEVFYFNTKTKKIFQLSACNGQGEFEEKGVLTPKPKTEKIQALAFNPALAWEGSRPPGILYASGDSEASRAYIFAPAEIHFPVVESESVSSVTATTATLNAKVNPKGSITRYAFQYISKAAYEENAPGERFAGATESPLGGSVLGASQEGLGAATALTGLAPDTEYHYRVVATSHCEPDDEEALCEETGEDEAFRTFPLEAPALPDNRVWELVSPAQKNGGEVVPSLHGPNSQVPGAGGPTYPMQSSPDGDAMVYEGQPFSYTEGALNFNEYFSKRTASGWQTTILAPALLRGGYLGFNTELTQGVFSQAGQSLTPEAPGEYQNLYTQPTANPSALTPLVGFEPPNRPPGGLYLDYAGASDDFTHIFFAANDALTSETPFAPEAVDGGGTKNNLYESVGGQLRLVNVLPGNAETVLGVQGDGFGFGSGGGADLPHAISADGSNVFWSDQAGQLYVRVNGESTTAIPDPGKYLTASEDGSKVLLQNGHLYDLETEETTDLTEGQAGFEGIAGQSEDLSRIYFVDAAVLSGKEENEHGDKAEAGKDNLYAWSEDESTFVATLTKEDNHFNGIGDWEVSPGSRTAEASPGGRWLAFLSRALLTDYDNSGPTCVYTNLEKYVSGNCPEAYLYDSSTGELHCASCNPAGTRPLGSASLPRLESSYQPRYLTDSGRLYFNSKDSLTPFDINRMIEGIGIDGKPNNASAVSTEDVYQYEPEGVGSCKRQAGCISLISAGHESLESNFLSMDETGKNVFFTSRDQLVLKDRDDLLDLYVARENGGIGSETETSRGECQGEACAAALVPPNDPTPGSSSFEGAGNVDEKKATKKHKHKKKKHAKKAHRNRAHKRAANHNRGGAA